MNCDGLNICYEVRFVSFSFSQIFTVHATDKIKRKKVKKIWVNNHEPFSRTFFVLVSKFCMFGCNRISVWFSLKRMFSQSDIVLLSVASKYRKIFRTRTFLHMVWWIQNLEGQFRLFHLWLVYCMIYDTFICKEVERYRTIMALLFYNAFRYVRDLQLIYTILLSAFNFFTRSKEFVGKERANMTYIQILLKGKLIIISSRIFKFAWKKFISWLTNIASLLSKLSCKKQLCVLYTHWTIPRYVRHSFQIYVDNIKFCNVGSFHLCCQHCSRKHFTRW